MGIENRPDKLSIEIATKYEVQKDSFSERRKWVHGECEHCGLGFFSKIVRPDCGSSSCNSELDFLHDERKQRIVSPLELNSAFRSFFEERGFEVYPAKSILNEDGTTLFTSAGVQILDNSILRGKPVPETPLLVSQPCLRTQYLDDMGEGNSLSFVNICTERINASPEDHIRTLDLWMDFLSKQGLYMGDVTLVEREKEQQWGNQKVQSKIIAVYYKGIEIGDGNYDYGFDPHIPGVASISDFGFGLERLTWIFRKDSYFDGVGPLNASLRGSGLEQELTKTLTLLAGHDLEPSNKDRGYRYRLFAKRLVALAFPEYLELRQMVDYYHQYWNQFTSLPASVDSTRFSVQREYDRNYNKIISDKLATNINPDCPTEDFLANLLRTDISRDKLVQMLQGRGK